MVGFFFSGGRFCKTLVATMPQHHPGPLMNTVTTSMAPSSNTPESDAALQAITSNAKDANTRQIAALAEGVDQTHVSEHIRGIVAVTMGHLSINAITTTRNHAEHWQQWALGVADGTAREVPAVA